MPLQFAAVTYCGKYKAGKEHKYIYKTKLNRNPVKYGIILSVNISINRVRVSIPQHIQHARSDNLVSL